MVAVGTGATVAVPKSPATGPLRASTVLAYAGAPFLTFYSGRAANSEKNPHQKHVWGLFTFPPKQSCQGFVSSTASTSSPGPCLSPPATPNLNFDHNCGCTTPGCCFDIRARRVPSQILSACPCSVRPPGASALRRDKPSRDTRRAGFHSLTAIQRPQIATVDSLQLQHRVRRVVEPCDGVRRNYQISFAHS